MVKRIVLDLEEYKLVRMRRVAMYILRRLKKQTILLNDADVVYFLLNCVVEVGSRRMRQERPVHRRRPYLRKD